MASTTEQKIETILDQTIFLLEKQRETQSHCLESFDSFLDSIKAHIQQAENEECAEDKKLLTTVSEIVSSHAQKYGELTQDDITFLEEQLALVKAIKQADKKEQDDFIETMIEEGGLLEDEEFKQETLSDATSAQQGISEMLHEFTQVLNQEGPQALIVLLEAMNEQTEKDREVDSDSDDGIPMSSVGSDEEIAKEKGNCCGTMEELGEDTCCGSGGVDMFSQLPKTVGAQRCSVEEMDIKNEDESSCKEGEYTNRPCCKDDPGKK